METGHVEKPLLRLRKLLDKFPADPRPEEVHSLRTQTRRLEAIIDLLILDRCREPRRLLKAITPVRKAAGEVRDMDVLIGDVLTLSKGQGKEALVRLVEHLSRMRLKKARRLDETIKRQRREVRKRLKRSTRLIRKKLKQNPSGTVGGAAAPQLLATELSQWPDLDEGNLHSFRIRVKELRYMLQLGVGSHGGWDGGWVDKLGELKDTIGEWHDWMQLLKIANKVLNPELDRATLRHIEAIGKKKFQLALAAANSTRAQYFNFHSNSAAAKPERY